jgi:hypothetical protein
VFLSLIALSRIAAIRVIRAPFPTIREIRAPFPTIREIRVP